MQPHMCLNAADELLDLVLLVHEDTEKATKLTYNVLPWSTLTSCHSNPYGPEHDHHRSRSATLLHDDIISYV